MNENIASVASAEELNQLEAEAAAAAPVVQDLGAAPAAPEKPKIATADMLRVLYTSASKILPVLQLTAVEVNTLAQAQGEALDEWFPGGLLADPKWLLTANAVFVTWTILQPRVEMLRAAKAASQQRNDAQTDVNQQAA